MDFVSGAISLAEKAGEAYGDYKRGRSVRLGTYKGCNGMKQFGNYNYAPKTFQTQGYV